MPSCFRLMPGEEEEDTESLRSRYFAGFDSQAFGGNRADYKEKVKALDGVLYQFVPSVDPSTLNVGDEFTVQLLNNGEPMADVDIIPDVLNHHTETIKTDENGMATVTASNGGVNVIGCEMVVAYENEGVDQKATRSKVFVSLSFTLYPEEED